MLLTQQLPLPCSCICRVGSEHWDPGRLMWRAPGCAAQAWYAAPSHSLDRLTVPGTPAAHMPALPPVHEHVAKGHLSHMALFWS